MEDCLYIADCQRGKTHIQNFIIDFDCRFKPVGLVIEFGYI